MRTARENEGEMLRNIPTLRCDFPCKTPLVSQGGEIATDYWLTCIHSACFISLFLYFWGACFVLFSAEVGLGMGGCLHTSKEFVTNLIHLKRRMSW